LTLDNNTRNLLLLARLPQNCCTVSD